MKKHLLTTISIFAVTCLLLGSTSCKKSRVSLETGPIADSTITDTTFFIDMTLDGKRVFQLSGSSGAPWSWTDTWYILGDTTIYPYSSLQCEFDADANPSVYGLYFSKNAYGTDMQTYTSSKAWWTPLMQKTFIDSFFKADNYGYAKFTGRDTTYTSALNPDPDRPRTQHLLTSGIHFIWFDGNSNVWQTCSGSGDQAGSSFTITQQTSEPFTFQPGYEDYTDQCIVTANFNCTLYDGAGHSMKLTNGKFRLPVKFRQFN